MKVKYIGLALIVVSIVQGLYCVSGMLEVAHFNPDLVCETGTRLISEATSEVNKISFEKICSGYKTHSRNILNWVISTSVIGSILSFLLLLLGIFLFKSKNIKVV